MKDSTGQMKMTQLSPKNCFSFALTLHLLFGKNLPIDPKASLSIPFASMAPNTQLHALETVLVDEEDTRIRCALLGCGMVSKIFLHLFCETDLGFSLMPFLCFRHARFPIDGPRTHLLYYGLFE